MKKTKEDMEDDINTLIRKRNTSILELNEIQKLIEEKTEQYYILSDDMVRVVCINCQGMGYGKDGEKKVICQVCKGKQYMWLKKFKEDENGNNKGNIKRK